MKQRDLEIKIAASKCASCVTKPCQLGCPLNNDISGFIKEVKNDNYEEAYRILCKTTVMPAICGKICPYEKQCQGSCAKRISYEAVNIGKIESYIGDLAILNNWKLPRKSRKNWNVAVIGSGPASLTCAAFLAEEGCQVTIYEKHDYLGGLLYHGIPDFRLTRNTLMETIQSILDLGIKVKKNISLGSDISLNQLKEEYDAVFLGTGANTSKKMGISGENLDGVYGGNELLENLQHPNYLNKKVVIIGGGNVAIDVARTVKRLGAKEVIIIYRREKSNMSAEVSEINEAKSDKVKFLFKTSVVRILGEEHVEKIECVKTELNDDGKVVDILNTNYMMDVDCVIMAIGSKTDDTLLNSLNLERDDTGYLAVNENNQTSDSKIFAAGDLTGTKSTVAWACRNGRDAAYSIIDYLKKVKV